MWRWPLEETIGVTHGRFFGSLVADIFNNNLGKQNWVSKLKFYLVFSYNLVLLLWRHCGHSSFCSFFFEGSNLVLVLTNFVKNSNFVVDCFLNSLVAKPLSDLYCDSSSNFQSNGWQQVQYNTDLQKQMQENLYRYEGVHKKMIKWKRVD